MLRGSRFRFSLAVETIVSERIRIAPCRDAGWRSNPCRGSTTCVTVRAFRTHGGRSHNDEALGSSLTGNR